MGKAGVKFEVIQEGLSQHENELRSLSSVGLPGCPRTGDYSWLKAEGSRQARE